MESKLLKFDCATSYELHRIDYEQYYIWIDTFSTKTFKSKIIGPESDIQLSKVNIGEIYEEKRQ